MGYIFLTEDNIRLVFKLLLSKQLDAFPLFINQYDPETTGGFDYDNLTSIGWHLFNANPMEVSNHPPGLNMQEIANANVLVIGNEHNLIQISHNASNTRITTHWRLRFMSWGGDGFVPSWTSWENTTPVLNLQDKLNDIDARFTGVGDTLSYLLDRVDAGPALGTLGDLPIGSIVPIPVDGVFRPFAVLRHNGAPNANYVGWGNCTFLILNMAYEMMIQNTPFYVDSPADYWMENDFITMLPEGLRSRLVQGRIPFATGLTAGTIQQGVNGLLRRAFTLAVTEIGHVAGVTNSFPIGADFGGFPTQESRILRNSAGLGVLQHTRSVNTTGNHNVGVSAVGNIGPAHALTANMAVRPVIALPPDVRVAAHNVLVA